MEEILSQIHTALILRERVSDEKSLAFGRSRRGSASSVAAVMVAIMFVATVVSGAIIYYSRGGTPPAIGSNSPSGNGLSGVLSNAQLANLTSALGGLSKPELANLTSALGGLSGNLSSPALTNLTSSLGGLSGAFPNSTLANFTVAIGGPVAVAASSLPAADFTPAGTASTFACGTSPSGAYMVVTDNGTESASVTSVTIATAGAVETFTPSGVCHIIAGTGAGTTYIIFPATSKISPSAVSGQHYAGVVGLSDGALVPFEGVWQ